MWDELCLFSVPVEEGTPALGTPPQDSPLFVLCLVLAALLLLSVLAFSIALLRLRKRSGKEFWIWTQNWDTIPTFWLSSAMEWVHSLVPTAMSSLGIPSPVQVTHSFPRLDAPSGIPNDYRETPNNLPKGSGGSGRSPQGLWGKMSWLVTDATSPCHPPDPLVTAISKDSDSDSEYYEFSSKPPVALSTFYSEHPTSSGIPDTLSWDPCHPGCSHPSPFPTDSLRRRSREDLLPLRPSQDRMEPFPGEGMTKGGVYPIDGRVATPSSNILVPTIDVLVPTAPARPGPPPRRSSSSSTSSSMEPYWNGSIPPAAHDSQWQPAATSHEYSTGGKCGSRDRETSRMGEKDADTTGMGREWGFRDTKERSRDGSRDRATPRMGTGMGSTPVRKWDLMEWEQEWKVPASDPAPPRSPSSPGSARPGALPALGTCSSGRSRSRQQLQHFLGGVVRERAGDP